MLQIGEPPLVPTMFSRATFEDLRKSHVDNLQQIIVTLRGKPGEMGTIDIAQSLKDIWKDTDKLREAGHRAGSRSSSVVPACFETRCDILKAELHHQSKKIREGKFHHEYILALLEVFMVQIGRLTVVEEDGDQFANEMESRTDVMDNGWKTSASLLNEVAEAERSAVYDCWRHLNSTVAHCHCSQCDKRRLVQAPLPQ